MKIYLIVSVIFLIIPSCKPDVPHTAKDIEPGNNCTSRYEYFHFDMQKMHNRKANKGAGTLELAARISIDAKGAPRKVTAIKLDAIKKFLQSEVVSLIEHRTPIKQIRSNIRQEVYEVKFEEKYKKFDNYTTHRGKDNNETEIVLMWNVTDNKFSYMTVQEKDDDYYYLISEDHYENPMGKRIDTDTEKIKNYFANLETESDTEDGGPCR